MEVVEVDGDVVLGDLGVEIDVGVRAGVGDLGRAVELELGDGRLGGGGNLETVEGGGSLDVEDAELRGGGLEVGAGVQSHLHRVTRASERRREERRTRQRGGGREEPRGQATARLPSPSSSPTSSSRLARYVESATRSGSGGMRERGETPRRDEIEAKHRKTWRGGVPCVSGATGASVVRSGVALGGVQIRHSLRQF